MKAQIYERVGGLKNGLGPVNLKSEVVDVI
jgi:hypothetical protein